MYAAYDYKAVLKQHLEDRCKANVRYSLRAFARDLDIAPARLSLILSGKQGLSQTSGLNLAKRLDLSTTEREAFLTSIEARDSRSKLRRGAAATKLASLRESDGERLLALDAFRMISDWYHYAVFELMALRAFKRDPKWIAKRLGITATQAENALERLLRLGIVEEKNGKLQRAQTFIATPSGIPSEAIRKFTLQILQKAMNAVVCQSVDERDISTLTVAIRVSELPAFQQHIKSFRRSFNKLAETQAASGTPDEIYCLAVQFFRLSEGEKS